MSTKHEVVYLHIRAKGTYVRVRRGSEPMAPGQVCMGILSVPPDIAVQVLRQDDAGALRRIQICVIFSARIGEKVQDLPAADPVVRDLIPQIEQAAATYKQMVAKRRGEIETAT